MLFEYKIFLARIMIRGYKLLIAIRKILFIFILIWLEFEPRTSRLLITHSIYSANTSINLVVEFQPHT